MSLLPFSLLFQQVVSFESTQIRLLPMRGGRPQTG